MKLSAKLTIIFTLFILVSSITTFLILSVVTENNFLVVEEDVHVDQVENIMEILKSDFVKIDALLIDYAHWEFTLDYIRGDYDNYEEENLPQAIYTDFNIDFILVYDEAGKALYQKQYDHETGVLSPVIQAHGDLFFAFKDQPGIIQHGEDLLYSSTYDITDNDDTVTTNGRMIFASYLDQDYLDSLSQ